MISDPPAFFANESISSNPFLLSVHEPQNIAVQGMDEQGKRRLIVFVVMSEKGSRLRGNETVVKCSPKQCDRCSEPTNYSLQLDLDCCKGLSFKEQIFVVKSVLASGLLWVLAHLRYIYKANFLQINKSFLEFGLPRTKIER